VGESRGEGFSERLDAELQIRRLYQAGPCLRLILESNMSGERWLAVRTNLTALKEVMHPQLPGDLRRRAVGVGPLGTCLQAGGMGVRSGLLVRRADLVECFGVSFQRLGCASQHGLTPAVFQALYEPKESPGCDEAGGFANATKA